MQRGSRTVEHDRTQAARPIVIFCDFDGTITERDMIITIMEKFAPPGWETVKDDILSQAISVQQGVAKLFSMIPSHQRQEIIDYALEVAQIRPGFEEFLGYCKEQGIQFLVTSGGIDFFVRPILKPYLDQGLIKGLYCNEADFSNDNIHIHWPHTCDEQCDGGCGLCKPSVMRQYPVDQYTRVVIGDSVTDLKAARLADHVIARAFLLQRCEVDSLRHDAFSDFYDVTRVVRRLQNTAQAEVDLVKIAANLTQKGWLPATAGNLSIKVQADPLQFCVTASGKDKEYLTTSDLLLVDAQCKPVAPTSLRPSAETLIHAQIYEHTDAGCVLHVHTVYNNLVAEMHAADGVLTLSQMELIKGLDIWEQDAEVSIPIIENYAEIPRLTSETVRRLVPRVPAVLIRRHGIYAWGRNVFEAKRHLQALEFMFEFYYKWKRGN